MNRIINLKEVNLSKKDIFTALGLEFQEFKKQIEKILLDFVEKPKQNFTSPDIAAANIISDLKKELKITQEDINKTLSDKPTPATVLKKIVRLLLYKKKGLVSLEELTKVILVIFYHNGLFAMKNPPVNFYI